MEKNYCALAIFIKVLLVAFGFIIGIFAGVIMLNIVSYLMNA
tara:strand:+ start:337 stop:462 length:126 start_codon:yes stop_codon:yes gene_type:complete